MQHSTESVNCFDAEMHLASVSMRVADIYKYVLSQIRYCSARPGVITAVAGRAAFQYEVVAADLIKTRQDLPTHYSISTCESCVP